MLYENAQRRSLLFVCIAIACQCSELLIAQSVPANEAEDSRVVALVEALAQAEPSAQEEAERLDRFLFAIGTLPNLKAQTIFETWNQREGASRAALALALSTCADEAIITALASEVANVEARTDDVYMHVLACARWLAIEGSLPALRDLAQPSYRAQVSADLLQVNTAAHGNPARARTAEFLDLFQRAGADAAGSPKAARLLLERAIGLCGHIDIDYAAELVRCAQGTKLAELRHALWIAISFALNQGYLEPGSTTKNPTPPSAEQIDAALEEAASDLANYPHLTAAQRIAAGFAAAGWQLEEEPAPRCGLLLEAATADAPWIRYHAMRLLAAEAGMHPDLSFVFFPERSRAHPCASVLTPTQREARLFAALRTWAETEHPALKR